MAEAVEEAPSRLRRVESVLSKRTQRIRLVLEQCIDSHNHQAVLRTAEAGAVEWAAAVCRLLPQSSRHHASAVEPHKPTTHPLVLRRVMTAPPKSRSQ